MNKKILFCLFIFGLIAMVPNVSASGEGWLDGWNSRQGITIIGSAGAGTNYQVLLNVTYDSDMQADFDDLRITDASGVTELDYWIESYIASTNASVWVEVAADLSSNQVIYMYWGNDGVISTSDGNETFPLWFADFDKYFDLQNADRDSAADVYVYADDVSNSSAFTINGKTEGLTYDGTYWYVGTFDTGNSKCYLYKLNSTYDIVDSVEVTDSTLIHVGGIDYYDGYIYVPVAENTDSPVNPSKLKRYDTDLNYYDTLFTTGTLGDDHLGNVVVVPSKDRIYTGNWGDSKYYVWELDGDYVTTIDASPQVDIQDMTLVDGLIYGSIYGGDFNLISVLEPSSNGNDLTKIGETITPNGRTTQGIVWVDGYFYTAYEDTTCYVYKLEGDDLGVRITVGPHDISSKNTIGPDVALEARTKQTGNRRHNSGFATSWGPAGDLWILHGSGGPLPTYEGNSDDGTKTYPDDTWCIESLGWKENYGAADVNRTGWETRDDDDIHDSALLAGLATWGTSDTTYYVHWVFVREWISGTEPTAIFSVWNELDPASLVFSVGFDMWGMDTALIILGLIMIPTSSLYLAYGVKHDRSSNRLFYGIIIFLVGCGLFVGGILPP